MPDSLMSYYIIHHRTIIINMSLAQRSAGTLRSLLTWVRVPIRGLRFSVKKMNLYFYYFFYYTPYTYYAHYFAGYCTSGDIGIAGLCQTQGSFCSVQLFMLGHTKYSGVQRVNCNPFPAKTFHASHRMNFVMIRSPGIDTGAFVVSPDTVWYARVLLLFSASASTDTSL